MCFGLGFTNLLKNSLAWVLGVSQSDLAAHHACAAPGGTLTKTHTNADTCLKIKNYLAVLIWPEFTSLLQIDSGYQFHHLIYEPLVESTL